MKQRHVVKWCGVLAGCLMLFSSAFAALTYDNGLLFRRGDANADGSVNLSDVVAIQNFLFAGGSAPPCMRSADANDDGRVNNSDGIFLLNYLFNGGPPPPAPSCGLDTTPDSLSCYASTCD